ncbi:DUF6504 family protein [Chloroflexota bacterium]
MTKLINEPITIHQNKGSNPTAFVWRKRLYRVIEVFDWWREPVEWWDGRSIPLFVRVNAKNASTGTYELCKTDDNWLLSRILD